MLSFVAYSIPEITAERFPVPKPVSAFTSIRVMFFAAPYVFDPTMPAT
jgi:hypothetical protein